MLAAYAGERGMRMKFRSKGGALLIETPGGRSIELNADTLFVSVGEVKPSYRMSRGSFKIRQKKLSETRLFLSHVKDGDGGAELELSSKNGGAVLAVSLTEDNGILKFTPRVLDGGNYNRLAFRLPASPDESVYGGGETFAEFDLRGKRQRVWVAEHINAGQIARKIIKSSLNIKAVDRKQRYSNYETYYAQPTFVSSKKYFVHCDTTDYAEFDFRKKQFHEIRINSVCPIYIGIAESFDELSEKLGTLLGRQPELPEWVYDGAILGIQGGTQTVYDKLEKAAEHGTAVAGVWCQDWEGRRVTAFGKQLQWNWEWDSERYPELDKKIWELKARGVRFLGYINPFLAIEKPLYAYAAKQGYCVKDAQGNDYLVKITTFPAAMVDLTNPEAYEWIKSVIKKNMIDFGLDGWMADFGEYLPTDCVLFSGENAEKVHNSWPARWAKVNREALEETGKLGEIFFFTRAGYTDTVKYSTLMWAGDQHTDWTVDFGLPSVIPASLALSMCGFGLTHSDIGGYTTFAKMRRNPELFMRWAEMNAFSPLMRSHEGSNPDLNAQFDANEQVLVHHAKFSRIHRALKPYLIDMAALNAERGIPVTRPLFYHYDGERERKESTEYLLGRDLLVAPIIREGAKSREVYFPDDRWISIWNGKEYGRGCAEIDAPIGTVPVFYRKNSEYSEIFEKLKEA